MDLRFFVAAGATAAIAAAVYFFFVKKQPASSPQMPTPEQVALVQSTWTMVRNGKGGLDPVGILFFNTLFEQQPSALGLFKKFNGEPDYKKSIAFKSHASAVINTVDTAFMLLHDLPTLVPVLKALGTAHVKYGVQPSHYDWIGAALLATLSLGLGDAFAPEVKQAYATVWGVVAATMIGSNYD